MEINKARHIVDECKAVYDKIAPHFAVTRRYLWEDLKPLRDYVKDGDAVLDLGCGSGRLPQLFDDLKIKYLGVDQSEAQIALARVSNPTREFVVADIRQVPRPDAAFDRVFAVAVLHHLPTRESRLAALAEMKRLAKLNATIILTNWNLMSRAAMERVRKGDWQQCGPHDFYVPWKDDGGVERARRYYHAFTADELSELAESSGAEIISQYYSSQGAVSDREAGENLITIISFTRKGRENTRKGRDKRGQAPRL